MDEYTQNEAYKVGRARNRSMSVRVDLLNENFNKVSSLEADIISGSITIQNAVNSDLARRKGNLVLVSKKDLNEDFYKISLKNSVQIFIIIKDNVRTLGDPNQSTKTLLNTALIEISNKGRISDTTMNSLKSIYSTVVFDSNTAKSKIQGLLNNLNATNKIEQAKYEYNMGIYVLNSPNTKISITERTITLDLCDLMENYSKFSNGLIGKLSIPINSPMTDVIQNIARNPNLMGLTKTVIESSDYVIPTALTFEQDTDIIDVLKKIISLHPIYDCYFDMNGYFIFEQIKQRLTDMAIDYIDNSCTLIVSIDYKKNFENVRNDIVVLGSISTDKTDTTKSVQAKYELRNETGNQLSIDKLGLHRKVIANDNNKTDLMCQNEAIYNMEKYSNLAENLTLQVVPMLYLVPNRVIEVNLDFEDITITGRWIIDSISVDLTSSGLQTITCHRLYNQHMTNNLDGSTFTDIRSGIVADGGVFGSTISGNTYNGGDF
ncbi:hypothetical protein psyc5s11_36590 [Clostridium gelidum]|uniref:Uncharacterized protein n=1 Tax=Clostridium gelidum TaxID=704125 RepID=A0ABM7T8G0_9CLOT|nr:hypothetical protein [Clostridium gelidum]BCZ47592.1 hypothetical protein psyc5s11_36590 [Clostridium gelidum]